MTGTGSRALAVVVTLLTAGILGGCASAGELALPARAGTEASAAGGATFADLQLQMRRESATAVLATAGRFVEKPDCTFARLAPANGARRAFPLERCEHVPTADEGTAGSVAGQPLRTLVTHYVDGRLARIDAIVVLADDTSFETVRSRLDDELGPSASSPDTRNGDWQVGDDVVRLVRLSADDARLSTIDGQVLRLLPGLDEDDPTSVPD